MGLDMYLTARVYASKYFNKELHAALESDIALRMHGIAPNELTYPVGQWRKSNQVHNWFVENVQKGVDDCGSYYVTREDLIKLKDTINTVLDDPDCADSLLPTRMGFFFGSTDLDEYYWDDLRETVIIIDRALAFLNTPGLMVEIFYSSSW